MLRPGEHAEEAPEDQVEAALCVLRRQRRDGRLLAKNARQCGDQIHHELPVRTQRLPEGITPAAQLRVAFPQERTEQTLQRLRQRRIRDVALVLIELA